MKNKNLRYTSDKMSRCDEYFPEPHPSFNSGACCKDLFKAHYSLKVISDTFTSSHYVKRGSVDSHQVLCSFTERINIYWMGIYWELLWVNAFHCVSGLRSMWCTLWLHLCQHAYTSVSAMDKRTGECQPCCCFCDHIIDNSILNLPLL